MFGQENFKVNSCVIKVMGIGGGGCNAINSMIESNVGSAEFIAVNTDSQALLMSNANTCLQIGEKLTKGLGAGSNPDVGEAAAEENREEIQNLLKGTDLLFIAAGMGGGTGTGAASVIARIARELDILTIAVVTKPFSFEGRVRNENANKGIANLKKYVDTIVIIPNDKLRQFLPAHVTMIDAFKVADDMLKQGIMSIVDLIATPSYINLDFADVNTVIRNQGLAHMGIGRAKGENRIIESVRQAVSSPLLETTIEGAKAVILNVTGGKDIELNEGSEAAELVGGIIDPSANFIYGVTIDENIVDEVKITIIATGFNSGSKEHEEKSAAASSTFDNRNSAAKIEESNMPPLLRNIEEEERKTQAAAEILSPIKEAPVSETQEKAEEEKTEEPEVVVEEEPVEKRKLPAFMRKLFGKKNK